MILYNDDGSPFIPKHSIKDKNRDKDGEGIDISSLINVADFNKIGTEDNPLCLTNINNNDLTELIKFCNAHNIMGLNFRHISNPQLILSMLKKKMGIVDNNINSSSINKTLLKG